MMNSKTNFSTRCSLSCFSIFLVAVLCGCGSRAPVKPDDLPKLVPCTITLTQENAPLAGATVSLATPGVKQQWIGGGTTNEKGVVDVFTNGRYKGSPEGKFKVVILKSEADDSKIPPRPADDSPEFGAWMNKYQNAQPDIYSLVDLQYTDPKTTPLEIDITGSKPITATFDTGKKVREKKN